MGDLEDVARLSEMARTARALSRSAVKDRNAAIRRAKGNGESRKDIAEQARLGAEAIDRICRQKPKPS